MNDTSSSSSRMLQIGVVEDG
ncbi:hypothetical protein A2U01_0100760, partial [Trifolium medium]|nr:hypothetical protein [Trifolium medium]